MSKEPLTVGVIGCGTIANAAHIPSYAKSKQARIGYFCDIIKERAEAAAAKYGFGRAVTDYREVLADNGVAAVSICTPNDSHLSISVDALNAGKHVLCEKPAARTLSDAKQMLEAKRRTGLTLNIGVVNRFNTTVNKIRGIIASGELGEVYHVVVNFRAHRSIPGLGGQFTNRAISGGGVLIDWGVHYLDLLMYCLDDPEPRSVLGKAYSKLGADMRGYVYTGMWAGPPDYDGVYDVDDYVTALVRTDGPTVSLNGAWAQNIGVKETYIDFLGTKAGIRLQYGGGFVLYGARDGMLYETTPSFVSGDMYFDEIESFLHCAATGQPSPASIENAVLTSKIMQGIYDSSDSGREIVF